MAQRLSLSEIYALSRNATRGIGYSWGLAEDAGTSVRWLSAYGFAGVETLAVFLQRIDGHIEAFKPKQLKSVWSSDSGFLCPIYGGAIINDRANFLIQGHAHQLHHVLYPLLILPQVARITETHNISLEVRINDIPTGCTNACLAIQDLQQIQISKGHITCQSAEITTITQLPSPQGRNASKEAIKTLKYYAHKTLVPATEASRLAGAGLTDND